MRRVIPVFGIVVAMCLLNIIPADACGDKTLRIGRGARFKRTTHTAAVLIYLPTRASGGAGAKAPTLQSVAPALQAVLKSQKLKSRTVQGAEGLAEGLKGQYDVVLTDLEDAGSLEKYIEASVSKPVLIPVASKETKAQAEIAKKQYGFVVKNATSADQYLDAIEDAMRSRMRGLAVKR